MNYAIKIVTVALIVCCSGCGTTNETLLINSDPTGARVTLSNGMAGKTPCSFLVPTKGETVVTIEKVGYESAQVTVAKKVQKQIYETIHEKRKFQNFDFSVFFPEF